MDDAQATVALLTALGKARGKFAAIHKDGTNPHLKNRYATIGSVLEAVSEPLLAEGLFPSQTPVPIDGGHWALQTTIYHVDGGSITGLVPLDYEQAKGLNPMQALGSSISYARRYGLLSILCLTAEDDDAASSHAPPAENRRDNGYRREEPPRQPRREERPPANRPPMGTEHNDQPPRHGRALYAWSAEQKKKTGFDVVGYLNKWGRIQLFPQRMTEWDAAQTAAGYQEAQRRMKAGDDETGGYEDAEVDRLAAREV